MCEIVIRIKIFVRNAPILADPVKMPPANGITATDKCVYLQIISAGCQ